MGNSTNFTCLGHDLFVQNLQICPIFIMTCILLTYFRLFLCCIEIFYGSATALLVKLFQVQKYFVRFICVHIRGNAKTVILQLHSPLWGLAQDKDDQTSLIMIWHTFLWSLTILTSTFDKFIIYLIFKQLPGIIKK